jgi:HNH endonuclease
MGGPFTKIRNKKGEGGLALGYKYSTVNGKRVFEHIAVAEKALGRKLPKGSVVHHVDENPLNNSPTNLVICPNASYHRLLHYRMRAKKECGDPDKKQCLFCKDWEEPELVKYNKASQVYFHTECRQKYRKERGHK